MIQILAELTTNQDMHPIDNMETTCYYKDPKCEHVCTSGCQKDFDCPDLEKCHHNIHCAREGCDECEVEFEEELKEDRKID